LAKTLSFLSSFQTLLVQMLTPESLCWDSTPAYMESLISSHDLCISVIIILSILFLH
jgi:hypothetical protein